MNNTKSIKSFQELITTPFSGAINAFYWKRKLVGDFSEIVQKIDFKENIKALGEEELRALHLSEQGQLARNILIKDLHLLRDHGADPILNLIKHYEKDDSFFPTDVYSWHVDRSPVATDTFLCTYHGAASEILPNAFGTQKILIPEIRAELFTLYDGPEAGFDDFLSEFFFDLHYQATPNASIINLGIGKLWKLAVDHPESEVLPCLHRAPVEEGGETRLLLIC